MDTLQSTHIFKCNEIHTIHCVTRQYIYLIKKTHQCQKHMINKNSLLAKFKHAARISLYKIFNKNLLLNNATVKNQQQNIKGSEKSNWKAFINPNKKKLY